MKKNPLYTIKEKVLCGKDINYNENHLIVSEATGILKRGKFDIPDIMEDAGLILDISNLLYNNSSTSYLPLDDDMYDSLVNLYRNNGGAFKIGAPPVSMQEKPDTKEFKDDILPIIPFTALDINTEKESFFINSNGLMRNPILNKKDLMVTPFIIKKEISKKVVAVPHVYPKLVGTLDKCKIVLNSEARDKGVYDNSNIKIFERDFLGKHLREGLIDMNTPFTMILELKYDGISVEAEVSDHIISARSRGDTANDQAADLTPILEGYPFKQAIGRVDPNDVFGMKFEAILTKYNLEQLGIDRDRYYKNGRNAVTGLFGALDGYMYRDFITLIPLATSIEEIDRIEEIEFMNKYYHSGEQLRYSVITGTYSEILFQVDKFVKEAEYMRPYIPFMYDGVVVSYADPILRNTLGRTNSVNNFSIAIKFNPLKKQTLFTGYDYTVGQTGIVTPMINFEPLEFFGTIHNKASGHSYAAFKELALRSGDLIDVEYVNDVMAYVTKPDNEYNRNNNKPLEQFIDKCPVCGSTLRISDSGKSAICDNISCPGRKISRLTTMVDRMNIKDFSEKSIEQVNINSFVDLMNLTVDDAKVLGEENSKKFIDRINQFRVEPIADYNLMSSLGFSNIAATTWKLILSNVSMQDILDMTDEELWISLHRIKGIGDATIDIVSRERELFKDDISWMVNNMSNIIITKGTSQEVKKVIRFSGINDKNLINQLSLEGYDIAHSAVTKNTDILIIPIYGFTSDKVTKAEALPNCKIVTLQDFVDNMKKYLSD